MRTYTGLMQEWVLSNHRWKDFRRCSLKTIYILKLERLFEIVLLNVNETVVKS